MSNRLGNARDELARRRGALAAVPDPSAPAPASDATASPEPVPHTGLLSEITRHPLNPRGEVQPDDKAIDELAGSIKELGILEPLLVASRQAFLAARPDLTEQIPDGARWVLIAGERRMVAARAANLRSVPIVSGDNLMAAGTDLEAMIVENIQRESLTPIQEARAYQALTEAGQSQRNIARRLGNRNQSHIARRLRLLRLPDEALAQIDAGTLPIKEAEILTDIAAEHVPAVWAEFTRQDWTSARDALNRVQAQLRAEKAAEASKKQAATEGLAIVDGDRLWRAELTEDDEIEEARIAGTLAAHVDRSGDLIYLNTEKLAATEDDHQARDYEAERRRKDAARRAAMKARRDIAGQLAATTPKAVALTDALVDYVLTRAGFDELKLAAKWIDPDAASPYDWKHSLAAQPVGERRRAAWAITLAHWETAASSEYSRLDDAGAAYLADLIAAGYQITDHDQARLDQHAADTDTEEDDTDD